MCVDLYMHDMTREETTSNIKLIKFTKIIKERK